MSEQPYIRPGDLGATILTFDVHVYSDGTRTLAELFHEDDNKEEDGPIGAGAAVRRKGERRNHGIGVGLAVARAFEEAAKNYRTVVEEELS